MMRAQKSPPMKPASGGQDRKGNRKNMLVTSEPVQVNSVPGCAMLRGFPPELFTIRAKAIMTASARPELDNAIARYAFAEMWARHSTGRGFDLARDVVSHRIHSYASFSPVRPRIRKRFIAHVVARMDEAALRAVEADA